jgi:ubiquinone/menaquinone biosynthesis C-methylase UbiE
VIGVDISDNMIACARAKSDQLGAPATWYCCDILDTPSHLNQTADLVYTGRGALNWIMDIEAWATVVARLLKPQRHAQNRNLLLRRSILLLMAQFLYLVPSVT